ncbi:hypothetical protein ACH5RR_027143 [Cinchona calisaya]|uniref:Uncharacterized protein n=1 Tax=Cinchona calisaya TaxID=153742 RepID=A0ABD2Z4L2_9GENT
MAKSEWKGEFVGTLLLVLQVCLKLGVVAAVFSRVEFLPGFDGQLPFQLETGYIGVDESEDVQLFYYFVKSQSNSRTDPLVLWITGGPGCTSLSRLVYEIGPFAFEAAEYNGSLPRLVLKPHSWTEVASIIFLDWPVGTGFSYARNAKAHESTSLQASDQAYQFLRKFLVDHPELVSNPFYIGGDSYSGRPVPIIVQLISNGNENGNEPLIDLKGYLLGNPIATPFDYSYRVQFAHGMGLISDELHETFNQVSNYYLFRVFHCHILGSHLLSSGDHDMVVPHFGTQEWIRSLNYNIIDDWRPWNVEGPVAGYTRTYANQMTFATVKGAGHTAPEFKPVECRAMFKRWMSYEPL